MLDASYFRALVSGERRGVFASFARLTLGVVEPFYRVGVARRNRQFDTGKRETHRVDVPVISVGNLTVGGTGKTPMVEWIARWFRDRDIRVAIVSRGYGAEAGSRNDEALELEQKLPDVPHLQNPNRVEAATAAIDELESQLIVLDDAFQHRRIHRDLNIVLIDALQPFGFGHLLPRGLLREPVGSLRRADVVVLSRADAVDEATRDVIRQDAMAYTTDASWCEVAHRPKCLVNATGDGSELSTPVGKRVAAFCGIGNPDGFWHTLNELEADLVGFREFPDHHAYERTDVDKLTSWAKELDAEMLLCTHKDIVKLGVDRLDDCPLFALQIELAILCGEAELTKRLEEIESQIKAAIGASDAG